MARAWEIERKVGKDGVLDRYLTLAPFGGNLEGVRAASLAYFGKEPRRLTIAEAALLVALPQAPEARRPGPASRGRARRARACADARGRARRDHRRDEAEAANAASRSRAHAAISRRSPRTRRRRRSPPTPGAEQIRLSIDARLQQKLEVLAKEHAERLGAETVGRHRRARQRQRRDSRPRRRRGLCRRRARRRDRHVDQAAFAGLGAETVHLRDGVRAGSRASRDDPV